MCGSAFASQQELNSSQRFFSFFPSLSSSSDFKSVCRQSLFPCLPAALLAMVYGFICCFATTTCHTTTLNVLMIIKNVSRIGEIREGRSGQPWSSSFDYYKIQIFCYLKLRTHFAATKRAPLYFKLFMLIDFQLISA